MSTQGFASPVSRRKKGPGTPSSVVKVMGGSMTFRTKSSLGWKKNADESRTTTASLDASIISFEDVTTIQDQSKLTGNWTLTLYAREDTFDDLKKKGIVTICTSDSAGNCGKVSSTNPTYITLRASKGGSLTDALADTGAQFGAGVSYSAGKKERKACDVSASSANRYCEHMGTVEFTTNGKTMSGLCQNGECRIYIGTS